MHCSVTGHPCEEHENPADFLLDLIISCEKEAATLNFVEVNPQVCFGSNNSASFVAFQNNYILLSRAIATSFEVVQLIVSMHKYSVTQTVQNTMTRI